MKREITIVGNWRKGGPDREWAGTGTVDRHGAIECSACLDGDAYDLIEDRIVDGDTEGSVTVYAEDGREVTYHWTLGPAPTVLHLWLSNQVPGAGYDCTADYIAAADWTAPASVELCGQTISGMDAEEVFAAFRALASAVADAGHGDDVDDSSLGQPRLTACPAGEREDGYKSARETLRRLTCDEAPTYADWVR